MLQNGDYITKGAIINAACHPCEQQAH